MRNKTAVLKYRFGEVVQKADSKVHQMYFYDDIRARGDCDWKTWSYKQSETSAKYIRDQLAKIPDADVLEGGRKRQSAVQGLWSHHRDPLQRAGRHRLARPAVGALL